MEAKLYNGLTLAYVGDAVYETSIRLYLLNLGYCKVNDLHKHAIKYTSGEAQAKVIRFFKENNILSEVELEYYKRGRNSSVPKIRKNITRMDYLDGTGFESLIGFLYLNKETNRMNELINLAINFIENGGDVHGDK